MAYLRALVARALAEANLADEDTEDLTLPIQPPRLLEGFCPRCNTITDAAAREWAEPALPLACAACGAPLSPPIIVARRAVGLPG